MVSGVGAVVLHERKTRFAEGGDRMSSTVDGAGLAAMAPQVGADLRAARERLGWTVDDLADGLRIRAQYLMALEDGRITALPGTAYAVGFLRTYAIALGLDPEEMTRRFRQEAAAVNRKTELAFPVPVPERGVPAGAVVLLGVVLAIGAYVGWYRLSGDGQLPPEVVAPVPSRLVPLAEQAPPVAPAAPAAPSTGASTHAAATVTAQAPATVAANTPAPAGTTVTAPATTPPSPVPSPATPQVTAVEPVVSVPPSQAAAATTMPPMGAVQTPPATDQPRIVLGATADAWLLVRDKSGQVLLNRVLHAGETWPVPAQPNLTLTTGNAGGTEVLVDGAAAPSLGASGAVRRDIPLDPDLLKSGKLGAVVPPVMTANSGGAIAPKSAPQ